MTITAFPPVESATDDGLVALGGDLEPASLMVAYQSGIFPWPMSEGLLAWFSPPQRAVMFLDEFRPTRQDDDGAPCRTWSRAVPPGVPNARAGALKKTVTVCGPIGCIEGGRYAGRSCRRI